MDNATKTRENRARRIAKRRGLIVQRCAVRDGRAVGFGLYSIRKVDEPPTPFDKTLAEIEAQLA